MERVTDIKNGILKHSIWIFGFCLLWAGFAFGQDEEVGTETDAETNAVYIEKHGFSFSRLSGCAGVLSMSKTC